MTDRSRRLPPEIRQRLESVDEINTRLRALILIGFVKPEITPKQLLDEPDNSIYETLPTNSAYDLKIVQFIKQQAETAIRDTDWVIFLAALELSHLTKEQGIEIIKLSSEIKSNIPINDR